MNSRFLSLALVLLTFVPALRAGQVAQPPAAAVRPAPAVPGFTATPAQVRERFDAAKGQLETRLKTVVDVPAADRTFANTLKEFETASAVYNDAIQPLIFLAYVSPDPEVRAAAQAVEVEAAQYGVALGTREDLYRAVAEYAAKGEALEGEDKRLLEVTLRAFKNSGMGLAADKREELKKMQERLALLQSEFEKNIGEHKDSLELALEQLKGLPQDYIDGLDKTADGKYVVTLKYPDYGPFMRYAADAELRRQLEFKFNNRAVQNVPLLEEALRLRHESARLLGHETFAHWVIEPRMAQSPHKVWDFLGSLWPILRGQGDRELKDILETKRQDDPKATEVRSWDLAYYANKLRQARYDYDPEEVKQYFPVDRVVSGTLNVYQRVLGVRFSQVAGAEVWHPDVKAFEIADAATGERIGRFYLDLHPRDGKYTHAAEFPLMQGRALDDGTYQGPAAAMVANFSKPTPGRPALLKFDEVETFFHEFGHVMHQTLTRARYASFAGTSVAQDFVEAPSQMLENFIWDRGVLDEISGHWQDPARKLPEELFAKMRAAKDFNQGLHYLRQLSFAMADMIFHTAVPRHTTVLFNKVMSLISLLTVQEGTHFEASFGHLMGGYGAGYYGYLWSEVFADDIFTRFAREGVLNPAVGMDYRRKVLERGSSRPEMDSLRDFLGREPSSEAFLSRLSGKGQEPADSPSRVSPDFLAAAQRQGLLKPLTGLDDPRLKSPDSLLAENWVKHELGGADVVIYRYTVGDGRTLQYHAAASDGRAVLVTLDYDAKGGRREERIVRGPDGAVSRGVVERETEMLVHLVRLAEAGALRAMEAAAAQEPGRALRDLLAAHGERIKAVPGVLSAEVGYGVAGTSQPLLIVKVEDSRDPEEVREALLSSVPELAGQPLNVMPAGTPLQFFGSRTGKPLWRWVAVAAALTVASIAAAHASLGPALLVASVAALAGAMAGMLAGIMVAGLIDAVKKGGIGAKGFNASLVGTGVLGAIAALVGSLLGPAYFNGVMLALAALLYGSLAAILIAKLVAFLRRPR